MGKKRVKWERVENNFYPEDGGRMFRQASIAYLRIYMTPYSIGITSRL
jgi:hypothetical protein